MMRETQNNFLLAVCAFCHNGGIVKMATISIKIEKKMPPVDKNCKKFHILPGNVIYPNIQSSSCTETTGFINGC